MNYIETIESALTYIEEQLKTQIKLEDLSNRAYLSKFHFHRIFKALTGYTTVEYIDRRKLSEVNHALKYSNQTILEIALEYGYKSHEVLSRKYKKHFGITPNQYRKQMTYIESFNRISIIERGIFNKNSELVVVFDVIKIKTRKIRGKACNNSNNDDQDPNAIGNFLFPFADTCFEDNSEGQLYLAILYHEQSLSEIEYFVGFDEDDNLVVYDDICLPESLYGIFKYKGVFRENIKTITDEIYRSIAASKWKSKDTGVEFIEVYNKQYLETLEFEIHVPIE